MIPKISVIVPVYNVEKYLPRCIDSILSQTFTDFELLLIDDGSPDNCGKICDEYAAKDSCVRVFHKPNGGVSSARNLGLDKAQGEWVTFIDSDDYVSPSYFEELFSATIDNPDFVVINNAVRNIEESNSVFLDSHHFKTLFSTYKIGRCSAPWGKLFNNDILTKYHLRFKTNIHFGEDAILVYSYLLKIRNVVLICSDSYCYEEGRPGSLTYTINSYESELLARNEFCAILEETIARFSLEKELTAGNQILLTERVILAIMRYSNRCDRISRLKKLDLTFYLQVKKAASWKESILLFLLRKKIYFLYDYLINLIR